MTENTLDVETLRDWLDRRRLITVLDVRPLDERAEWFIPGSVHVDAYQALRSGDPNALVDVKLRSDVPVVTICAAGNTSMIAAEVLRRRGVEARSVRGGMKAWSLAWNTAEVKISSSNVKIIQVRRTGKGCLSYVIGSNSEAAVIDASVDVKVYLSLAESNGWKITRVLDTHVHADHLSRSRQLAEQTGATLFLPDTNRVKYNYAPLHHNDTIQIGTAQIAALHTPGHTPESTCYLLDDEVVLSGDTLFLSSVGRPDLETRPEETGERAKILWRSLQQLLTLPPQTILLPAHTSKPVEFDGKPICKTLADIYQTVEILHLPVNMFVETILSRIPATPPSHHRIVQLNEAGLFPEEDPTTLEAGANRCAVS